MRTEERMIRGMRLGRELGRAYVMVSPRAARRSLVVLMLESQRSGPVLPSRAGVELACCHRAGL